MAFMKNITDESLARQKSWESDEILVPDFTNG